MSRVKPSAIRIAGIAIAMSFGIAGSWGQSQDRILPIEGPPVEGTIKSATPTHLIVETRGGERRFPVENIKLIRFGGEPNGLTRARSALQDEQYDAVLQELGSIDASELSNPMVQEDVLFLRTLAKAKKGDDAEATAREVVAFLKTNSQTYHYFEAMELLGDLLMQMGRFDSAADSFAKMGKAPWPATKVRAAVREAQALQAQGPDQLQDAIKRYDQVIGANLTGPEFERQKQLARVGRAACQAELGETDKAIEELMDVIARSDAQDIELFARANNALGACYRKSNKPKYAELYYTKTDLLFSQASDAHAESLYYLSELGRELGHADRAQSAQRRLRAQYAQSPWARK